MVMPPRLQLHYGFYTANNGIEKPLAWYLNNTANYRINESPKILVSQLLRRLQKVTFQHYAYASWSVKQMEDIYLSWITTRLKRENQLRLRCKIWRQNFMKSRRVNQT